MAHNFFNGIDWIGDPTGNTALASWAFQSLSGNDLNAGTDPNLPKLTIASAIVAGTNINVGTEEEIATADINFNIYRNLICDQKYGRIYKGASKVYDFGNTPAGEMRNMIITDFDNVKLASNGGGNRYTSYMIVKDCNKVVAAGHCRGWDYCYFIDIPDIETSIMDTGEKNRSAFFNCNCNMLQNVAFVDSIFNYFHTDTDISGYTLNQAQGNEATIRYSIIRGRVEVDSVWYNSIQDARDTLGDQTLFPTCTMDDPLFLGDPSNLEFNVPLNSPAIMESGEVIGGLYPTVTAGLQNETSTEWGVSPNANVNTQFNSGNLELVTPGGSGYLESIEIDLGQEYIAPEAIFNGIWGSSLNTPDFNNALTNSNVLTVEIDWAADDQVYHGSFESFRYGYPMMHDSTNDKYTGESGYSVFYEIPLTVRYVKVRTTIRDDYNPS